MMVGLLQLKRNNTLSCVSSNILQSPVLGTICKYKQRYGTVTVKVTIGLEKLREIGSRKETRPHVDKMQ